MNDKTETSFDAPAVASMGNRRDLTTGLVLLSVDFRCPPGWDNDRLVAWIERAQTTITACDRIEKWCEQLVETNAECCGACEGDAQEMADSLRAILRGEMPATISGPGTL